METVILNIGASVLRFDAPLCQTTRRGISTAGNVCNEIAWQSPHAFPTDQIKIT